MHRLNVALVHRDSIRLTEARMVGWWSYAVPEFTWLHIPVDPGTRGEGLRPPRLGICESRAERI